MTDSSSYETGYQQQTQEKHSDQLREAGHAKPVIRHQSAQLQRTERSQRNKDPEPKVEAEYTKGQGGKVKTLTKFGKAHLIQEFKFGSDGDLIGVTVEKRLQRGFLKSAKEQFALGNIPLPPEMSMQLAKGEDGKFEVIRKSTTPALNQWEDAFADYVVKQTSQAQPHQSYEAEYQPMQQGYSGNKTEQNKPT